MKKKSEILTYNLPDGSSNVEVLLNEDDIWMNKDALVSLYQTSRQNIEKHIKHIYEEGELDVNRTCNKKLQVQTEGKRQVKREVAYYNLKMIIAPLLVALVLTIISIVKKDYKWRIISNYSLIVISIAMIVLTTLFMFI
ncbi:MAG: hypothetical protein J6W64_03155 [Bacilli bacterium]|nr:hypothetical protein [Bacilli bacterium]